MGVEIKFGIYVYHTEETGAPLIRFFEQAAGFIPIAEQRVDLCCNVGVFLG